MWWSSRTLLVLALAVAIGGCGYRPLYGEASGGDELARELATIEVGIIEGRIGQQLRNALEQRLLRSGTAEGPGYQLRITLNEQISSVSLRRDNTTARANLRINGNFELRRGGQTVWRGQSIAVASYNVLDRQYATIASQLDARERAVQQLADDIVRRLAVFLSRERKET